VPRFDQAFAGLVTDLEDRGLLDETLVVYMTEFGRTPKVNSQAGRDHWPRVFSVAFAGAGIRTGQVLGASDQDGGEVAEFPVSPEQIAATILSLVGIHPQTEFRKQDGRPIMYVDHAQPIAPLLV
jgi:arylsulfatase A-like enzyme